MSLMILGLVLFLGTHSVRIFADDWRTAQIARVGANGWKALYSIVSLAGFALTAWGYGLARASPVELWDPPRWTAHVTALLTLPAFVLMFAGKVPGTRLKAAVGHPMVLGVKVWAVAHLLSNGRLGDVILFGAFLLWAVVDFRAARQRDRAAGTTYPRGTFMRDLVAAAVGGAVWAAFAFYLHEPLIGVKPFA